MLKAETGPAAAGTRAGLPGCCGLRIRGFNAKSQSRKDAKSFSLLCAFAVQFPRIAHFWQSFPNRLSQLQMTNFQ
jgi:hypothetical protein